MVSMHLAVAALCLTLARASLGCGLVNVTISVEREECGGCITFNTTACAGLCFTQDSVYKSSLKPYPQQACNFREVVYETVRIPGCPNGIDTVFTYPVARRCGCSRCDTDTTDCSPPKTDAPGCLNY